LFIFILVYDGEKGDPSCVFRPETPFLSAQAKRTSHNVEAVREYTRQQPEHHAKNSFQDELRDWLQRYEIEWDERSAWD
jgi:hypothetical protein